MNQQHHIIDQLFSVFPKEYLFTEQLAMAHIPGDTALWTTRPWKNHTRPRDSSTCWLQCGRNERQVISFSQLHKTIHLEKTNLQLEYVYPMY